jgi:dTDP-4-amino-4,6-dideoxygalactose transaminase
MTEERGIPLVDLRYPYEVAAGEIDRAVGGVLQSRRFILGPEVRSFEEEMASYLESPHAVGVGSGTAALYLALLALGIGAGDEVITTPFTFIATAEAVAQCGATPVFVDIDPSTFNLDPEAVQDRITSRTRAIIVVHIYGLPAEMVTLRRLADSRGIALIEDCAQAAGAEYEGRKVGSLGDAAAFSFFPTKNLGCAGDGGMVCTRDAEVARRVRALRAHGSEKKYLHDVIGVNSRLDEIQAAILRVMLRHLDRFNDMRREIASLYGDRLDGVRPPVEPERGKHVYHLFTIKTMGRDDLMERLSAEGIGCRVYYPVPLHLQPCFSHLGYGPGDFPVTESVTGEILSIPMFLGMSGEEVDRVCDVINGWVAHDR